MATKGIWVDIEIMHDKNLTANQKFILSEISQLSQLDKGCYAHNKHFSDFIGIAKESVSRSIKDLDNKGYISIEITNGSRNHERLLTLNKTSSPPKQNVKPPLTKHQETKGNKTINKTISIPSVSEIAKYIADKSLNVDANKFFNYFDESGWVDSKGNKVKNWKQKILTWDNYAKPKEVKRMVRFG